MTSQAPASPRAAPLAVGERSPTPDVARGVALLGIALANSVVYITGRDELGPSFRPVGGTTADRVTDVLVGVLVDNRAFPMFTLLVAYGFVVVARRQAARGAPWPRTRSLLLRRTLWLGAFGLAHLVLVFAGDILLVYGLLGLGLVLLLLRARRRTLVVVGALTLLPYLAFHGIDGMPGAAAGPVLALPYDDPTYLAGLVDRAGTAATYVLTAPLVWLVFVTPAVVGVLLARAQVLEQPAEHLPFLRRLALGGLGLGVVGAVPLALASVQVLPVGVGSGYLIGVLHAGTGLAGAVGFAALVGWAVGARDRSAAADGTRWTPTGAWRVAAAVGQRSLTCYLLQSVLMVPLLMPWAAGLGVGAGTAFVGAVGVAVYALIAVFAVVLDRAGRAGPAEVLLRRLVYGRPVAAS